MASLQDFDAAVKQNRALAESGDITQAERMLRGFGGAVGLFTDPLAEIIQTLTPEVRYKGETLGELFQQSSAGQWLQQNPRAAENIGAGLGLSELLAPAVGGMFGKAANTVAKSTPANIPKFYDNMNPIAQTYRTGQAVLNQTGDITRDLLSPQARAARRETGMPSARRKEINQETTKNFSNASMATAEAIQRQQGRNISGGIAQFQDSPFSRGNYVAQGIDARTQRPTLEKHVFEGVDIPESFQKRMMDDVYYHFVDTDKNLGAKEAQVKRLDAVTTSQAGGKDKIPDLQSEAVGSGSGGSQVVRTLSSKNMLDDYAKYMAKLEKRPSAEVGGKDVVEVMSVAGAVDKNFIEGLKKYAKRESITPQQVVMEVLKGRQELARGIEPSAFRKKVMDYWGYSNKKPVTVKDGKRNVVSNADPMKVSEGDMNYFMGSSHISATKELGGVHDTIGVDWKNQKMYSMISDGSDLFGMNPAGGHSLFTVTPVVEVKLGKNRGDQWYRSADKGDRNAAMEEGMKNLAQRSGIQPLPNEKPMDFQRRVMNETAANARPELRDYLGAAKNVGMLTGAPALVATENDLTF